jgi:hypothetical protein
LSEEKSKHASLAQQNGFGPAFLHRTLRTVKGTQQSLTPAAVDWLDSLIGPVRLLLLVSRLFAIPV